MPAALDEGSDAAPGWVGHVAAAGLKAELAKVKLAVLAFLFQDSKVSTDSKLQRSYKKPESSRAVFL